MSKKETFDAIFDIVMSESEIDYCDLVNTKVRTREVVDARCLLVHFLLDYAGFSVSYVSKYLSMTVQGVRQIKFSFYDRMKQGGKIFAITHERIRKKVESI